MDNHIINLHTNRLADHFTTNTSDLIRQRYSCRVCLKTPVEGELLRKLEAFAGAISTGPFGTPLRFRIISASDHHTSELRGLGTYGFIRNPAGFIIGTAGQGMLNLEDFGYAMESIVLYATQLGLGSCWLGGTFTRSSFSDIIRPADGEILPAVVSFGYPAENSRKHTIRKLAGSNNRKDWNELFFNSSPSKILTREEAGEFTTALEMVRLAPSASNKQPWRIVKENGNFYFFLKRDNNTKKVSLLNRILKLADLPRVDMGIAMSHFDLALQSLGVTGHWEISNYQISGSSPWEYSASFMPD